MRAIIVDDEMLMIQKFRRMTKNIDDFEIVDSFTSAKDALEYVTYHQIDLVFLDIQLPGTNGIVLAQQLKALKNDLIIVFVTAYEKYIHEANEVGGDYYLIKPYTVKGIENMTEHLRFLSGKLRKDIYIQTFGRFLMTYKRKPVPLNGRSKEILAYLVVMSRGKEVSNDEIYQTLWEHRPVDNQSKTVYFNAMRRLKNILNDNGITNLIIPTSRGQIINTDLFECDYYDWLNKHDSKNGDGFEGQFLPEYSWAETILADLLIDYYEEE